MLLLLNEFTCSADTNDPPPRITIFVLKYQCGGSNRAEKKCGSEFKKKDLIMMNSMAKKVFFPLMEANLYLQSIYTDSTDIKKKSNLGPSCQKKNAGDLT